MSPDCLNCSPPAIAKMIKNGSVAIPNPALLITMLFSSCSADVTANCQNSRLHRCESLTAVQ